MGDDIGLCADNLFRKPNDWQGDDWLTMCDNAFLSLRFTWTLFLLVIFFQDLIFELPCRTFSNLIKKSGSGVKKILGGRLFHFF